MGERANLIVIREGRYDLRYSHWAAYTLHRDLFWGPQQAIAFAEAQRAFGWLIDVWAEGGAVIDADRHAFRLFGGENIKYDVPLRRLYLSLLDVVWQDWEVGWAHEGIAELADYVGHPRDQVITAGLDPTIMPDLQPPEQADWVHVVTSVRLVNGLLRLFPLAGQLEGYYLVMGPPLADAAVSQPGLGRLRLADWTSSFPTGGIHLDVRSRCLLYWSAADQPGGSTRVADRWPGWSVTWLHDRYEDQLAACGGALSFPTRSTRELFDELRPMLLAPSRGSMGEKISELNEVNRSEGPASGFNQLALHDDQVELSADAKAEILYRAAAELGLA